MKIICVITTRDRTELFSRALNSVINQVRKPDSIIVVSDSIQGNKSFEKKTAIAVGAEFIENKYTSNYAGSLNTAMHYIIEKTLFCENDYSNTYIALLDDDDIWHSTYLQKCEQKLNGEDFIISGLIYSDENGKRELSIPQTVSLDSYLRENPHIQGSNTFIKFSTLLHAGLFDENMSSTTDRDIFARVMLLNPTYAVLNEYLVEADAFNSRKRITNGHEKKADGLKKFYYKYGGYMLDDTKRAFFERAEYLFGIKKNEITDISYGIPKLERPAITQNYIGHLTIGFIATDYELGLRLLHQIIELRREKTKVVIMTNFYRDSTQYADLLKKSGYEYEIIDKAQVLERVKNGYFDQFVTEDKLQGDIIRDIAVARTVLQKYLYELTEPNDIVWVLDEDMELCELVLQGGGAVERKLNIDGIIAMYKNEYDAVVGNYSLDAPLPTLSTIRTSLLDFVYTKTSNIGTISTLSSLDDYYYDLSDNGNIHLETPICLNNKECTLDDIFSGKANSRPLCVYSGDIREVKSRGGNTLIFNRELLNIPNWSIQVNDIIGRRSDYFWAWQVKQRGYKIASVPFATLHNRSAQTFDMRREQDKFLSDLIGASFTKAIDEVSVTEDTRAFYSVYNRIFVNRLSKFVASYYRIQGLLAIVGDSKYSQIFNSDDLRYFVCKAQNYLQSDTVLTAYETLCRNLHMQSVMNKLEEICDDIKKYFGLKNELRVLGNGGEGVALTDEKYVYKVFFSPLKNHDFLCKAALTFECCEQCYHLEFFDVKGRTVIRYKYEKSEPYKGGHAREFAEFIAFLKAHNIAYDNYKQSNYIVVNGRLKLVDYGKSFVPYTEYLYRKSITRVYQMLRYPFLSKDEFKLLIARSYQHKTEYLDDGQDLFEALVRCRYKEELHDVALLQRLGEYSFDTVLDYGAGKCKIANALANKRKVDVFDIDLDTLHKRASSQVNIIESADNIAADKYDLVLSNLVLCCVDDETASYIVRDLVRAVKANGRVIISICNPFFNSVQNTELRTCGLSGNYNTAERYEKHTTVGVSIRAEYHRPIEYYINLFKRNGLTIDSIIEGQGVDADTLLPIAEHLIFDCRKSQNPIVYKDCSLLIKTNPMEYKSIYRNIRHIVDSLENGGKFERRFVVVDLTQTDMRARKYDEDNTEKLCAEIERAKANGLIDEIVYARDDCAKMRNTYKKYFDVESVVGHSANGQGLYATLVGFDAVPTRYVFQTDSDILYYNNAESFTEGFDKLQNGAVTATIGIATSQGSESSYGKRTEVRTCFLDLYKLKKTMQNYVKNGVIQLPWHRALDAELSFRESVRLANKNIWFVHPENDKKKYANFVSYAEQCVSVGQVPSIQFGHVNLQGTKKDWTPRVDSKAVIYIRGYNTPCEKLKRLFDSLKKQTYQDFAIVYVDDASQNESAEYARFIFSYDRYFKGKVTAFFNDTNIGELANFVFAMQNVITNSDTVVINLDNDDYLVNDAAIERIIKEFNNGADITVGNCVRYDKPLKHYKIVSFDKPWMRDGDNLWLHPKCFKRYLFDYIDVDNDLKLDEKYIEVNTDFAFMLPMLDKAKKSVFIDEILYYFEPSVDNMQKQGKYNAEYKARVKAKLLLKEKERHEKNRGGNR